MLKYISLTISCSTNLIFLYRDGKYFTINKFLHIKHLNYKGNME